MRNQTGRVLSKATVLPRSHLFLCLCFFPSFSSVDFLLLFSPACRLFPLPFRRRPILWKPSNRRARHGSVPRPFEAALAALFFRTARLRPLGGKPRPLRRAFSNAIAEGACEMNQRQENGPSVMASGRCKNVQMLRGVDSTAAHSPVAGCFLFWLPCVERSHLNRRCSERRKRMSNARRARGEGTRMMCAEKAWWGRSRGKEKIREERRDVACRRGGTKRAGSNNDRQVGNRGERDGG